MDNPERNILKWRFDVSTFRLIGRELITDRITALFELVKNSYDANSTRVDVIFETISSINPYSKITIKDNGYGMEFEDIRDKWMVIGTSSKRKEPYSPEPFNRRCVGEKGIGRFAVDKLGDKVNIITKKIGTNQKLNVEIDWNKYETSFQQQNKDEQVGNTTELKEKSLKIKDETQKSLIITEEDSQDKIILFTDIENKYQYEDAKTDEQGTTLEISGIREVWTKNDIDRLYKELTKLVSPFYPLNPPFDIYIKSNEYDTYKQDTIVKVDTTQYASHSANIGFDLNNNIQEELYFDEINGEIKKRKVQAKSFGLISMQLYYFDASAKKRYKAKYKNDETRIDGVKIYRDGLITTPFAEFEEHPDKKRDILGIDKRLWRDIFNRLSTRDIIGVIDITKERNPQIIDATNRQDFVENNEYKKLKQFIIDQIDVFSDLRIYEREKGKITVTEDLEKASEDVKEFVKTIEILEKNNPTLKQELSPLKKQARQVDSAVKKGVSEQKKAEKEFLRKENIYLSLMSLQDYAANMSHAVRTSLGKIKDKAEFFKLHYPNSDLEDFFKLYSIEIYEEMTILNKVINYMLSYAGSNIPFDDFDVKKLIENLFAEYQFRFKTEAITPSIEIRDNFIINANKQFFADIFQNLIDNSIKALKEKSDKRIKCSGYIENDSFILFFSDNGVGIKDGDRKKVFELYYTSTAEDGGAGLGLFIVKTRIEALRGTVEVVDNEFLPTGTTVKITLPFKK
ncbi:MAG: ATP-binding protein [Bacteroidales bacterium]|jgi:signal transduction histidine kinase|nr:ATP-binding protein [Bacteroidales bacterium]